MKRRHAKRTSNDKGAPKWMVTYSDMVTLILVFFVLLFSMSQIDQERFEAVSQSFQDRVIFEFLPSSVPLEGESQGSSTGDQQGQSEFPVVDNTEEDTDQDGGNNGEDDNANSLIEDVQTFLDENNLNGVMTVNRTEEGVALVLQDSILFETAEAEILDSAEAFLDKVGIFLQDIPNHVRVEGHTDSRPIYNYRYPSNWELSGARASSVIRYLTEEFGLEVARFTSVGYADTRPVAPNDSESNWQKNRRVEIVILETEEGAE